MQLPQPVSHPDSAEDRKHHIVVEYASKNWKPFCSISVTDIIVSFLLDHDASEVEKFIFLPDQKKSRKATPSSDQAEIPGKSPWLDRFSRLKTSYPALIGALNQKYPNDTHDSEIESFFLDEMPQLRAELRGAIGKRYISVFQTLGDSIRKNGQAIADPAKKIGNGSDQFFNLPERVALVAECLIRRGKTRLVIDAIRNPFEIVFFKQRFSNFFTVAVSTSSDDREARLTDDLIKSEIRVVDDKEYPQKSKPLRTHADFVSQDIATCLQHADIHVTNFGKSSEGKVPRLSELTRQLVKYVCLMEHPGLVTPTNVERCMQAAFTAKLNSGCLSRQVGAVVTDDGFAIRSIGWNDVPLGQVSCLLRLYDEFLDSHGVPDKVQGPKQRQAFSKFEKDDASFRKSVLSRYGTQKHFDVTGGLPLRFCFKDEYNTHRGTDNQVHTRSLHAEENAFLQISKHGGQGLKGGKLFSTASPCELCSKKAYQIGILDIYYVDPYPGISTDHVLGSGSAMPNLHLFSGAIGSAYHRLYLPLLPYKDEINTVALVTNRLV